MFVLGATLIALFVWAANRHEAAVTIERIARSPRDDGAVMLEFSYQVNGRTSIELWIAGRRSRTFRNESVFFGSHGGGTCIILVENADCELEGFEQAQLGEHHVRIGQRLDVLKARNEKCREHEVFFKAR